MGPSGCGKSTLARALASALGWHFIEGDDHHPAANIMKMKAGKPLTEADRLPFLKRVGRELTAHSPAVASCSALTSSSRDVLRGFDDDILFVWPRVSRETLFRRIEGREGHFMPADLLESQLSTLEPPSGDENFLSIDGEMPTWQQIDAVLDYVSQTDC